MANHSEIFRDLRLSVAGIVFLGTSHQGSDAAGYGKWLARTAGCDTTLLESLIKITKFYMKFNRILKKATIILTLCFYEEKFGLLGVKVCMPKSFFFVKS